MARDSIPLFSLPLPQLEVLRAACPSKLRFAFSVIAFPKLSSAARSYLSSNSKTRWRRKRKRKMPSAVDY